MRRSRCKQPDPNFAFELGDPLRDRGLGGVELLGGAAKAAERHHPHEGLNCLEISHASSVRRSINQDLSILIKNDD
jgi:hypothetical protein